MKPVVQSIFLLVAISTLIGCAASKDLNPNSKIVFGYFGGFAGSYTEFTIFGDGEIVFKNSLRDEGVVIRQLDQKTVKDLFEKIHNLKLYELTIYNPGNLSYFLKFNYKNKDYDLLWGGEEEAPDTLREYFRQLSILTKDRNPIM